MTQKKAVSSMLRAGKRLVDDAAFDQEELQETLESAEGRWNELNAKVGEYELWLETSLQATQSYESSVAYINSFLNDTEETLALNAGVAGDLDSLKRQVEQIEVRSPPPSPSTHTPPHTPSHSYLHPDLSA